VHERVAPNSEFSVRRARQKAVPSGPVGKFGVVSTVVKTYCSPLCFDRREFIKRESDHDWSSVWCFDDNGPYPRNRIYVLPAVAFCSRSSRQVARACSRPDRLGQGRRSRDRRINGKVIISCTPSVSFRSAAGPVPLSSCQCTRAPVAAAGRSLRICSWRSPQFQQRLKEAAGKPPLSFSLCLLAATHRL
jgi:hypothetical protein